MKPRFTARESALLYGVIMGSVFLFYLLGLSLGNGPSAGSQEVAGPPGVQAAPIQDVKPSLDFYQQLVLREELEGPGPAEPALSEKPAAEDEEPAREGSLEPALLQYTVQVGAFKSPVDARQLRLRLEGKGYSSVLKEPSQSDSFYRVWIGEFSSEEAARQMESELRGDGFLTYIKALPLSSPVR